MDAVEESVPYSSRDASEDLAEDSMEAPAEVAPDSMEALEWVLPDSMETLGSVLPVSMEAPDSAAPDCMESLVEVLPDSVLPDSTIVPDSVLPEDQPSLCVRCSTTHGDSDEEGCHLARRLASRCARCGLVHRDYDLAAKIMGDMEKFDCEVFIPDVNELQMDGDTILVPDHVLIKLDKQMEDAKNKQ